VLALLLAAVLLGCGASHATSRAPLAAEIDRAQATIDDASASPASLEKAAQSEQLAFRELADRLALRQPTLARLAPAARSAASAAIGAADALTKILPVEHRFPHWRILRPPPATKLLAYFHAAANAFGIAWRYLAAIEFVETRMGRIHGLSPAGAQGPMQFMPATWAEYGRGSIDNPREAIMAAARFLAANGGRKDIGGALFHYNPSRSYVVGVESYAREMRRNGRAFYAYYYWEVLYQTTKGTFILPVGYPRVRPRPLP
jgi:membrane-bound lytic murein transglycosylase B